MHPIFALVFLPFFLLFSGCESKKESSSSDQPLFDAQWYLYNTGQSAGAALPGTPEEDINLDAVWGSYKGRGITIAIIDSGIEEDHRDLSDNVDTTLGATYYNGVMIRSDSSPSEAEPTLQLQNEPVDAAHGTACAGIAAAGDNGFGISGVAPEAALVGLNTFADTTYGQFQSFADALYSPDRPIDIYSNSWTDGPGLINEESPEYIAITDGIRNGRDHKGGIYVFSAGNYRAEKQDANWFRELNNPYVITVAALDADGHFASYSDFGANILISGFGGEFGVSKPAIVTTDLTGAYGFDSLEPNPFTQTHYKIAGNETAAYTNRMNGTSAAVPMVAGVCALILQANPDLTYRDLRYILAVTARKNDPHDGDWIQNGAGHWVNRNYGFGAVDAAAAVVMAEGFSPLADQRSVVYDSGDCNLSTGDSQSLDLNITVAETMVVEHAELHLLLEHENPGDLNITLTSPAGTGSRLSHPLTSLPRGFFFDYAGNHGATLGSVHYLDENSSGSWHIGIDDITTGNAGNLYRYRLTLYGRKP